MTPLQELLNQADASLADRIERLAAVINMSDSVSGAGFKQEVLGWMKKPDLTSLALGIAGRIGLVEIAEQVYQKLQIKSLPAADYSRFMLALGELDYSQAADLIERRFLRGKTRSAATIALMQLAPSRTGSSFSWYEQKDPEKGARVAGIGILARYARKGVIGARECFRFVPPVMLNRIPEYFDVPRELAEDLQDYIRLI